MVHILNDIRYLMTVSLKSILSKARTETARALMRTFIARAFAAFGSLVLALVIGRIYGLEGMGVYALAQSMLLGTAILARQGMDIGLVRYVGRHHSAPKIYQYLLWAIKRSVVFSLIGSLVLWMFRVPIQTIFSADGLSEVLIGIAVASPAFTLGFIFSGFFKALRRPATAAILENGSVALVAGTIIISWSAVLGEVKLSLIGYSYAISAWLVALQAAYQILLLRKKHRLDFQGEGARDVSYGEFTATSRSFFYTNFAKLMQTVLGTMIAGLIISNAELGLFKSAQQVAVLIGFILIVINAVLPPRFASLYHQGEAHALGRLARQGALLGCLIATPLLGLCLIFPRWVLGWFGSEFQEGAVMLRIIAIAQLVNVATGSVVALLNMTGNERLMRNIALVCNALGLVAFAILPHFWGGIGAALALAFALVIQNMAALFFVWRRLGIWTLPVPNILIWLGVQSKDELK